MKFNAILGFFALLSIQAFGQAPAFNFNKKEVETNLKFLASNELAGRRTGSAGEQLAADFIVKQLESYGVKPAPGQADFIQKVPFTNFKPPKKASLKIGINNFTADNNLLIINGKSMNVETEIIFAGNGWVDVARGIDDYKDLDVKGKIVLTITGTPDGNDPAEVMKSMRKKQELAAEHGAIVLLEAYRLAMPWQFAKSFFGKERMDISSEEKDVNIVYGWVQEQNPGILQLVKDQEQVAVKLNIVIGDTKNLLANNIVGVIEGTDDSLKNEYLLLSAHYDHVGMGRQGGAAFTAQDSIFNGARDNCMGTVALLAAAKELAAHPPKRSVLILACTAEEMGMLGSQWYADHPLVPLKDMVFNLNNDGAGYNSTENFNIIGLGYTNMDEELGMAGLLAGLTMLGDPAPDQNLYQRSDNISFANIGIPAVDFAPGITEMDEEIYKYYHQVTDNADSLDYDYVLKFCQAYTLAARLIADKAGKIEWEGAGKVYAK